MNGYNGRMALRIGILSAAHVHTPSYAHCINNSPRAELAGVWDDDVVRGERFAAEFKTSFFGHLEDLFERCDAVAIASENIKHVELATKAAEQRKHILCEKPLATTTTDAKQMVDAAVAGGVVLMTALPCPFSPAFVKVLARIQSGDLGQIIAATTTNQGTCPFGWFVDEPVSGGGALIDHTVHVADLLHRLIGRNAVEVYAATGNNMHATSVENVAMLSLDYGDGVFASLDASWSKPAGYKTWGNVTLKLVCEKGLIEIDLFRQGVDVFQSQSPNHGIHGYMSNLDAMMFDEFVEAVEQGRAPLVTGEHGLAAVQIVDAAYASVRSGQPEAVAS